MGRHHIAQVAIRKTGIGQDLRERRLQLAAVEDIEKILPGDADGQGRCQLVDQLLVDHARHLRRRREGQGIIVYAGASLRAIGRGGDRSARIEDVGAAHDHIGGSLEVRDSLQDDGAADTRQLGHIALPIGPDAIARPVGIDHAERIPFAGGLRDRALDGDHPALDEVSVAGRIGIAHRHELVDAEDVAADAGLADMARPGGGSLRRTAGLPTASLLHGSPGSVVEDLRSQYALNVPSILLDHAHIVLRHGAGAKQSEKDRCGQSLI